VQSSKPSGYLLVSRLLFENGMDAARLYPMIGLVLLWQNPEKLSMASVTLHGRRQIFVAPVLIS
jgi:hypothetical protein